jgi:ABC-type branched-subunit amino acid transport system substrate-binding protein
VLKRVGLIVSVAAFVAAAAVAAAMAAQSRTQASTINIGWDGDQSGPTVSAQSPIMHAIEAYFKMVNAAGGVNGHQLNLIEKDDGYSPANELVVVKSLISDDHVPVIMGLGQSSGFGSVLPVLTQSKTIGFMTQATLKDASYPFQPYIFEGNCNYSDQGDVGLAYEMKHLNLKNLKGIKVGIVAINVASGTEWDQDLTARIQKLGGTVVHETLPSTATDASVQVQDLISNKVNFVMIHHAISGGIVFLKSADQYGLKVPIVTSFGPAQPALYTSTPYNANKNTVVINCADPPTIAKTAQGKLALTIAQKYGYSQAEYTQSNWSLGWTAAQTMVQALKNANGDYSSAGIKKGLEKIRNLKTGLTPDITYTPTCHMGIRSARPYTFSYKTNLLVPIGSFAQWQPYITNGYAGPGTCGVPHAKG